MANNLSSFLKLAGTVLGLLVVVLYNAAPSYRVQVEIALLAALVSGFAAFDFWKYRSEPGMFEGLLWAALAHLALSALVWQILPLHPLLIIGFACLERFAIMFICFKVMERSGQR